MGGGAVVGESGHQFGGGKGRGGDRGGIGQDGGVTEGNKMKIPWTEH